MSHCRGRAADYPGPGVVAADVDGDARGLFRSLDCEGDLELCLDPAVDLFNAIKMYARSQLRVGWDWCWKADSVQPVVDGHAESHDLIDSGCQLG